MGDSIMTMLKKIPRAISPDLLKVLASMGHGDEIVLADANFPSSSIAAEGKKAELISCDSIQIPQLLEAILELMPLDTYARPAAVMAVLAQDEDTVKTPEVWQEYQTIIEEAESRTIAFEEIERFAF